MKYIIALLLVINPLTDLDKIARENKAKIAAESAYLAGDYEMANTKYIYLIDSLGVKDDRARLNLANSQYHIQDTINSLSNYKQLINSVDKNVSSLAYQQLGEIAFEKQQYEPALQHYKQALKKNPASNDARYNYELLKKLIKEQEEQQQQEEQNQDQDQEKQDQEQQEKQDQEKQDQEQQDQQQEQEQEEGEENKEEQQQQEEGEENEEESKEEQQNPEEGEESDEEKQQEPTPSPEDKLKEMNISEEKAQMILEAMKNNEVQYIQQNKRKSKKPKDPNKPDW
jgi:Ca-activated chloride channel family protein